MAVFKRITCPEGQVSEPAATSSPSPLPDTYLRSPWTNATQNCVTGFEFFRLSSAPLDHERTGHPAAKALIETRGSYSDIQRAGVELSPGRAFQVAQNVTAEGLEVAR
jgi:hypothetical protein